jgi:hypothetical protein
MENFIKWKGCFRLCKCKSFKWLNFTNHLALSLNTQGNQKATGLGLYVHCSSTPYSIREPYYRARFSHKFSFCVSIQVAQSHTSLCIVSDTCHLLLTQRNLDRKVGWLHKPVSPSRPGRGGTRQLFRKLEVVIANQARNELGHFQH